MDFLTVAIITLYLAGMLVFGWWGRRRTKDTADFFVAGRRLGPLLYVGTLSALVLGGASTVGGVGLGYKFGLSGMWLVISIGVGVILLSLLFARTISRLKIYTVSQMLSLRYGAKATRASSIIMLLYTLMLVATSTQAYATVFIVVFGMERWLAIALGGVIVVIYSTIGGMWSITLADMAQFLFQTIGIFALMLPFTLSAAGGWSGISERLGAQFTTWDSIGWTMIGTYFITFTLGLLIGQDIWQRVFTARSEGVAKWGGFASGIYVVLYGIAGAVIGMAARAALSGDEIAAKDDVYARIATDLLPAGIGALVLAAAVAAMMSTASGALIAAATVTRVDILPMLASWRAKNDGDASSSAAAHHPEHRGTSEAEELGKDRMWVLIYGIITIILAIALSDVVAALTIAYNILVGGLLVAIVGGLFFKRGNAAGALASMAVGFLVTVGLMVGIGVAAGDWQTGVYANEPIIYGLLAALVSYVVVSLMTPPTPEGVRRAWDERLSLARKKTG